jgi:pimeloyl-ACP methyl ester carboxylesterase
MPGPTHFKASDLRGLVRAASDATIGVTEVVETMHHHIVHPSFLPSTPIQNLVSSIAGLVFSSVKGISRLLGHGLDAVLAAVPEETEEESSLQRDALIAGMNGVVGDYLERNGNPLAIPMRFRYEGQALSLDPHSLQQVYPQANGKILLVVHGLCMNDRQWSYKGHDHGQKLAAEMGLTPVYLHYNTGIHISTNGQSLSLLLDQLLAAWPQPVEELLIMTHSMGGLVSRSAIHYGRKEGKQWPQYLEKVVFMGTPHHGAPLEQAGNHIDKFLEALHYGKPFARLGKVRSAGIKDLRHGYLVDEDWQADSSGKVDQKTHVPLPLGVDCLGIAASMSPDRDHLPTHTVGDGLVHLHSALGQHLDPARNLHFTDLWVVKESGHLEMLANAQVYEIIKSWLSGENQ